MSMGNVHPDEIKKFGGHAVRWWDPKGELKTLHAVNPLRLQFIQSLSPLRGCKAVDVGCGGGILTEALAQAGAEVLGIDLSEDLLRVAEQHSRQNGVTVQYVRASAEELAASCPSEFDVVTCMEMLEHVPNPAAIVEACARLVKPGGKVFFSTLNRNLKSYLLAIIGAEYLLRLIPQGTHDFAAFIRPSELCLWARAAGLDLLVMEGIGYNLFTGQFHLTADVQVNYLAGFLRPVD